MTRLNTLSHLTVFAAIALTVFLTGACNDGVPVAKEVSAEPVTEPAADSSPDGERQSESSNEQQKAEQQRQNATPLLNPETHDIYPLEHAGVSQASDDRGADSEGPELRGKVNLNKGTLDDLMMLPGVGPAIAGRIADYRQKRRFEEPSHIKRIKGIGEKTWEKLRPYLATSGKTTLSK